MSRQQIRRSLYREAFQFISETYPGEPRAARKKIAKARMLLNWKNRLATREREK